MDLQTLFMGEPEYDNNGRIVGRKLGVQNMIAWLVVGLVGYQLMYRGGKKQKGGESLEENLSMLWNDKWFRGWLFGLAVINLGLGIHPFTPDRGTSMFLGTVSWIVVPICILVIWVVPRWIKGVYDKVYDKVYEKIVNS